MLPAILGAVVVLLLAFVAFQVMKPGMKRKAAVAEAVAKARSKAKDPNDHAAQLDLAKVLIDLAVSPPEALGILERVEAAKPNCWPTAAGSGRPAKVLIGEAHVAMGQLDKAIEAFQRFVAAVPDYETGGDKELKWKLETFKVDAEQRIRLLKKGDTHVHQPEHWGDRDE